MAGKSTEEEQEVLVYIDFNTKMEDDYFSPDKELKMIGLDEDRPVLQLGNQIFQGQWRDAMGTLIFLEESKTSHKCDSTFSEAPELNMKYSCKTDKVLHMSRVFLNPKNANNENPESEANENDMDL